MNKSITFLCVLNILCAFSLGQGNESIPPDLKSKTILVYSFRPRHSERSEESSSRTKKNDDYEKTFEKKSISRYDKEGKLLATEQYAVYGALTNLTEKTVCQYDKETGRRTESIVYGPTENIIEKHIYQYDE